MPYLFNLPPFFSSMREFVGIQFRKLLFRPVRRITLLRKVRLLNLQYKLYKLFFSLVGAAGRGAKEQAQIWYSVVFKH